MKRLNFFATLVALVFGFSLFTLADAQDSTQAQNQYRYRSKKAVKVQTENTAQHGRQFIDLDGDGYNDNAPDADGDGIPNGLDPDYTGPKTRAGHGAKGFVDLDGDGINDNAMDADGDGIPNGQDPDYVRPMDGSGAKKMFGAQKKGMTPQGTGTGTGDCDGTGPKGNAKRMGGNR